MHEAGHGRVGIFAARVGHFPGGGVCFLDARDDLLADGAMLVRRVNEVEEEGCDGEREFGFGELRAGEFLGREGGHQALELFERGDAVFELPMPVVPVGVGNIAPEAAPGGCELFQGVQGGGVRAAVARWVVV